MFRIAIVWLYLASLLICPLRCAKSLPLNHVPSQVGQHVHCCSGCSHFQANHSQANHSQANHSQRDSSQRLEDPAASFPNSGCGCLTCVCKSTLCVSKETFSDDVPEQQPAVLSYPIRRVNRSLSFVAASRAMRREIGPYGRGMRQLLQSWLI